MLRNDTFFNRTIFKSIGLLISFTFISLYVLGQNFPAEPKGLVSDFTNTLTTSEVNNLENKLLAFEDSTSTQIAVVLVQSTDGYDIADYAVRLAQQWGVGQEEYNNGIILLIALADRAVTIQTGYGVEGALPDAIAYRIIEDDITPAFRMGDYYTGINEATSSIIAYVKGEYKADPKKKRKTDESDGAVGSIIVVIIVVVAIAIISKGGGGKGNGRRGRVIDGKGGSDLFWWMLLNGLGRGGSDRDSGGGFGGGFGGDSSGGGGFGGFGGGSFGGGGASGRW